MGINSFKKAYQHVYSLAIGNVPLHQYQASSHENSLMIIFAIATSVLVIFGMNSLIAFMADAHAFIIEN